MSSVFSWNKLAFLKFPIRHNDTLTIQKKQKTKQNSDDIHVKIQDNIFDPSFGGNPIQFY